MTKTLSSKNSQESKTQKAATKKLDFLLDSIDTEVANLSEVVDVEGPILDDKTCERGGGAISLSDGGSGLDSLELDMDFFAQTEKSPAEEESADKGAQAAIGAMNDAEGEVEAILSMAETSEDPALTSAPVTEHNEVNPDLAEALDELLATREVDASKVLAEAEEQKDVHYRESKAEKVQTVEEQLPEDLFDDLDKDLELLLEGAAAENHEASSGEPAADLLGDQEMDFDADKPVEPAIKEGATEGGIPNDAFDTPEQNGAAEENEERSAEAVDSTSSSNEELADLLSKKIEGLVNRLVEERLSEIAERVIMEKINKIFSSMK